MSGFFIIGTQSSTAQMAKVWIQSCFQSIFSLKVVYKAHNDGKQKTFWNHNFVCLNFWFFLFNCSRANLCHSTEKSRSNLKHLFAWSSGKSSHQNLPIRHQTWTNSGKLEQTTAKRTIVHALNSHRLHLLSIVYSYESVCRWWSQLLAQVSMRWSFLWSSLSTFCAFILHSFSSCGYKMRSRLRIRTSCSFLVRTFPTLCSFPCFCFIFLR